MFCYDEATRHQVAVERIERLVADYARANTRRRRLRSRWELLLNAGTHLVERTRPSDQRSPLRALTDE